MEKGREGKGCQTERSERNREKELGELVNSVMENSRGDKMKRDSKEREGQA